MVCGKVSAYLDFALKVSEGFDFLFLLHLLQPLGQQGSLHIVEHRNDADARPCLRCRDMQLHVPCFCGSVGKAVIDVDDFRLKLQCYLVSFF